MKRDIKNRTDIERLVNAFYEKIKADKAISYFFTDVAKVDWNKHLPRMYDFWENILFATGNYDGNPMATHKELSKKCEINKKHYNQWNKIFSTTVDDLFAGEKATEIKQRALNISSAMMEKGV